MKKIENISKTKTVPDKVVKELKTNSTSVYKTLTDNNFTDQNLASLMALGLSQGSFTRLWTGTLINAGDVATCSDRPINYDFLIIQGYFNLMFIQPATIGTRALTNMVIGNDDTSSSVYQVIDVLDFIGTHTIALTRNKRVQVTGGQTNSIVLNDRFGQITAIYGLKFQRPSGT